MGVDRQKARFVENLQRFARACPPTTPCCGACAARARARWPRPPSWPSRRGAPDLKLVEVDRDQVTALPALFDLLRARPERFVVLCDDLSFEEGAAAAKALKSALEGGVSGPPANVLFVATSNRRHLMPRGHGEDRGLIAAAEDAEEEVSVSDRFGLWIGFPPMDQPTYLAAVQGYAKRYGLKAADLDRRALQWAQLRGARSGRVAWQFIRDLAGELGKAAAAVGLPLQGGTRHFGSTSFGSTGRARSSGFGGVADLEVQLRLGDAAGLCRPGRSPGPGVTFCCIFTSIVDRWP